MFLLAPPRTNAAGVAFLKEMPKTVAPSIASITTAYNAERTLPRQIESLLSQTRPLQEIIVVDNASTDGTVTMLATRYPQVTVLRMPENLGAAGAWAAGLSYAALEKRHDWVWTFDDDSVPQPDALEILLDGVRDLEVEHSDIGIAAGLAVNGETGDLYKPVLWRDDFVQPPAAVLAQANWFADIVIASGCMVRREVVERIGLPRADFFMDVFDFEYCLRARNAGYKLAIINGARVVHEIGNARKIRLPGYSRLWTKQTPWREYYISRNLCYLAWWLYPNVRSKRAIARYLTVHAIQIGLFGSRKLDCLTKMAQGLHDGHRGALGIRFRPEAGQFGGHSPHVPADSLVQEKA
jgi:rhamnopyranosyl-N-acetylglucosaminyl-diphospho-decaprenol beta-1,3/1,4-galactofuranosyltransferase